MAVIEYDEYKQKLLALEPALQDLEKALEFYRRAIKLGSADAERRYDSLRRSMEDPSAGECAPRPEGASAEEMMGWNSMCL